MKRKTLASFVGFLAVLAVAGSARATGSFSNLKVTIYGLSASNSAVYDRAYSVRVDWTYTWDTYADRPYGNDTITLFEQDPWFNDIIDSKVYSASSNASKGSYSGYVNFNKPLATNDTVDGEEDWKSLKICANVVQPTANSGKKTSPVATQIVYVKPQNVTGLSVPKYFAADGSVTLSWNSTPGARTYAMGRRTKGDRGWPVIPSSSKTSYKDTPPSSLDSCDYIVFGQNLSVGRDQLSEMGTVSTVVYGKPFAPSSISYPSTATANYAVNWTASFGAQKYYLEEQKVGTSTWNRIADTSSTSCVVRYAGKPRGAQYKYRVQAYNPSGNRGTWTAGSGTVTIK